VIVFQHLFVLKKRRVIRRTCRCAVLLHLMRSQPNRRQQQHRSRKCHRRRRLDLRQLTKQFAHRPKLFHAHPACGARRQVLLRLGALALFQPPVHVRQNPRFHPFTAHDRFPSIPNLFPKSSTSSTSPASNFPASFRASLLPCFLVSASAHQRRQLHSERLVRSKQQRLQRALRTTQDLCDFRIIQFLVLVQQHRRSLLLRQFVDGVPDHLPFRLLHQVLLDVWPLVRKLELP